VENGAPASLDELLKSVEVGTSRDVDPLCVDDAPVGDLVIEIPMGPDGSGLFAWAVASTSPAATYQPNVIAGNWFDSALGLGWVVGARARTWLESLRDELKRIPEGTYVHLRLRSHMIWAREGEEIAFLEGRTLADTGPERGSKLDYASNAGEIGSPFEFCFRLVGTLGGGGIDFRFDRLDLILPPPPPPVTPTAPGGVVANPGGLIRDLAGTRVAGRGVLGRFRARDLVGEPLMVIGAKPSQVKLSFTADLDPATVTAGTVQFMMIAPARPVLTHVVPPTPVPFTIAVEGRVVTLTTANALDAGTYQITVIAGDDGVKSGGSPLQDAPNNLVIPITVG
jgi:hypothetical protein